MTGVITDIQRFSIHDGPGIRTTVFLKGCNLRCRWCHNPETILARPQVQVFPERCIACGACVTACPSGAHAREGGRGVFQRDRCQACGACTRGCYAQCLVLVGRAVTPEDVLAEVLADKAFYARSGGGVTLSGGEPLWQPKFAIKVLGLCRANGIHTAIETNLAWPWVYARPVVASADLVMCDLKHLDSGRHEEWTGQPNAQVLENIRRVSVSGLPLIVRTPIIPTFNDTPEAVAAIAEFLVGLPKLLHYDLLPYHPLGSGKYEGLGMSYDLPDLPQPSRQLMQELGRAAQRPGLSVRINGEPARRVS